MKKLILFALVAVLTLGSGFAQQRDPAARLQRDIEGIAAALSLSQEEVALITPILTEAQKKQLEAFAKMRESGDMDREKMREEIARMRAESDKELKAVLTAEQGVKLDAYRKQQAEERAKRMQE